MNFSEDNADGARLSENDRLIKVLQTCFSELAWKQEEQAKKQEQQADKLHQAVEALRPKVPVTDRKTAFWKAYKKLADEHDEEFQRKYSTDLDAALIFAGLFSAVASAFIIQIQAGIQLHDTPSLVLIAQNMLYISLFSTLLAALLAVLGKQWLMYYLAAGERGTLETRGLERQRKFDGVCRWKFNTVIQVFPLLLQIGLFLFSTALSIYLWTIHISLAITVLSITSFGFISYTALLVSAVAAPDSPFQTPLAPVIAQFVPTTLWMKLKTFSGLPLQFIYRLPAACSPYISASANILPFFQNDKQTEKNISTLDVPPTIFDAHFPDPSPEVSAVSWALEASTDPHVINLAAEMVVHLQWPNTINARPHLNRLYDSLLACCTFFYTDGGTTILTKDLDGMALRATNLGRAYCALRWILLSGQPTHRFGYALPALNTLRPELANVLLNLTGIPVVPRDPDLGMGIKWALRIIPSIHYSDSLSKYQNLEYFLNQFDNAIPSLDIQSFTDYLFCINSFLSTINPCDIGWMDKSQFQGKLFDQTWVSLLASLKDKAISMDTAAKAISTTGRLATKDHSFPGVWALGNPNRDFQPKIFSFCSSLPHTEGWNSVVLATGLLSMQYPCRLKFRQGSGDPSWIYETMESIRGFTHSHEWVSKNASGVAGLFNALIYYDTPPAKEHIYLLLQALLIPGRISEYAADLLLNNSRRWFQDEELQPILQTPSLWASLMRVSPNIWYLTKDLITLGHFFAFTLDWQQFIQGELCSWIMLFFRAEADSGSWTVAEEYNSVLSRLWHLDTGEYEFIDAGERALGLTFMALSKIWTAIDFTGSDVCNKLVHMLYCTNSTVLRASYPSASFSNEKEDDGKYHSRLVGITSRFITAFSQPLHDSLTCAIVAIKSFVIRENTPSNADEVVPGQLRVLHYIANLLEDLASKIPASGAAADLDKEEDQWHWMELRSQFEEEIGVLEKSFCSGQSLWDNQPRISTPPLDAISCT